MARARLLILAFVIATAAFLVFPGLDLATSGLFFVPGQGFPLDGRPAIEAVRFFIWDTSDGMAAVAFIGSVWALWKKSDSLRTWGTIFLLYFIGPFLLVNVGLKSHWGRARPADVTEFGGTHAFTPFWQPANECMLNCSFVSGEASAATAFGLALWLVRRRWGARWPRWVDRTVAILAFAIPLIVFVQRVSAGRHFLSDATFAVLLTLAVYLLLRPLACPRRAAA